MDDASSFRTAFIAMLVLSVSVGGYHRWQAARSREPISRREEGWLIFVPLRLGGLVLLVSAFAWCIDPAWMRWAELPLPPAVRWLGAATGLASVAFMGWTMHHLGKNLTDTVVTRREHTLVTTGPYRWVRHPFYVTAALLMLSATLLTANAALGLAGLVVLSLLAIRTPREEAEDLHRPIWRRLPQLHGPHGTVHPSHCKGSE